MGQNYTVIKQFVINIGLLDDAKIQKALLEQAKTKERLSIIFVRLGYISNHNVGKTLIGQIGIIPSIITTTDIEEKAIDLFPKQLVVPHRIIPLRQVDDKLMLGTDDPLNFLASDNFSNIIGRSVEFILLETASLDNILQKVYLTEEKPAVDFEKMSEGIKETKGGAEDAPIIKLVNIIINEAVKRRASDIHIEPLEHKFRVRYRIDGVLHEVQGPPQRLQGSVISRIKIMAGMDIAEKRLPQDGRIKMSLDKKELDLRVSNLPAIHGESVVMRILDKSNFLVGVEDLGFLPDHKQAFEKLIKMPNGMILITGPTGSGKTTTLYATLANINKKERKVITIEDPVEYQLDGINQVQVKPQIGLTFASGLRSMLRQAPDIIMVGEIRDVETAQIAIQSALTGHLIFSTLHTNDSVSAVTRLIDMG
ncbi:MAG: GspE/PulE family protein, partial [Candidatus Omnitrophota bacterium]|nr:GspE/PulE family protein [Candidatus Omnitrophota bacterium]